VHRAEQLRVFPAALRYISAEPLLGSLDSLDLAAIDWVIAWRRVGAAPPAAAGRARAGAARRRRAVLLQAARRPRPGSGGRLLDGRAWDEMPRFSRAAA
jgi:protein gp37